MAFLRDNILIVAERLDVNSVDDKINSQLTLFSR